MTAIARCDRRDRGDVGPRCGFGEGEGGDRLPRRHVGQPASLLLGRAEERDGSAAQALQREGEVGETVMIGQRLACEAEGTDVEPRVILGDGGGEQPGFAERGDQPAARTVGVAVIDKVRSLPRSEGGDALAPCRMPRLEERPGKEAQVGHQLPSKTGFRFAAKAS